MMIYGYTPKALVEKYKVQIAIFAVGMFLGIVLF